MSFSRKDLPQYLQSYDEFFNFFENELGDSENTMQKGERFTLFVQKFVSQTDFGADYGSLNINPKKTHDKGVDLISRSEDDSRKLLVQSKYRITEKSHFNAIISEFEAFYLDDQDELEQERGEKQLSFLPEQNSKGLEYVFCIVTLRKIENIVERYKKHNYATGEFYQKLVKENRIKIFDGKEILKVLQDLFRKTYITTPSIQLFMESQPLNEGNVYIGIVAASEIARIHKETGDSIFFENIRKFQGFDKEVNLEIQKTIVDTPHAMLERNNGITFRAKQVVVKPKDGKCLELKEVSIINGCQTTICLANTPHSKAKVLVKVVAESDPKRSWEITKAANFQNKVTRIDLDISRYVRPQSIERVAQQLGLRIRDSDSGIFELLSSIAMMESSYDEMKSLFIALFSDKPSNVINADYDRIKASLLQRLWEEDGEDLKILETVFALQRFSEEALNRIIDAQRENSQKRSTSKAFFEVFGRFKSEKGSKYRAYLSVLAACFTVRKNIYSRQEQTTSLSYEDMESFLGSLKLVFDQDKEVFIVKYKEVVKKLVADIIKGEISYDRILQNMYSRIRESNFNILYDQLIWNEEIDLS